MRSEYFDRQLAEAIRLLGVYTAGRFDLDRLLGNAKASARAHIMSALIGQRMPQSHSGITALRSALWNAAGVEGNCIAAREDAFREYCRQTAGGAA